MAGEIEITRRYALLVALVALGACATTVELPVPDEMQIVQRGPQEVELSWRLVVRVDGYLLHYDEQPSEPLLGQGLQLVQWPEGCGDFDTPVLEVNSPVRIPEAWCLDVTPLSGDAAAEPSQTPGTRPRVRLQNLQPQRSYTFAVQSFRRESTSALSTPISISLTSGGADAGP